MNTLTIFTNQNSKNKNKNVTNQSILPNNQKNKKNTSVLNVIAETIGIKESIPPSVSPSKRHYFIGYILQDQTQIQLLTNIQKELIAKYALRNYYLNFHNQFVTRYVYLGYLTQDVAVKYMDHIMSPLCTQVTKKFPILNCHYTKIRPKIEKTVSWVSIFYDDQNQYLRNIIIPFLDKKGIQDIYPKRFTNYQPMIDLIHFKEGQISRKTHIDIPVPTQTFFIDHLSLLSAKPTQAKMGYQSIHDNLSYEEEAKYYFPFQSA